ncbi:MAG: ComEC/Rec2 family competence protein, partial [Methylotenera sp.]
MILVALMFVFGAWIVQQLPQLPNVSWLLCGIAVSVLLLFLAQNHSYFSKNFRLTNLHAARLLHRVLITTAAFLFGICWASGFALWRMSDELPHVWEQKTITLIGVVASLPEATEHGVRFQFDVENVITPNAIVPHHISLNQYSNSQYEAKLVSTFEALNQFHAGERWQLAVRLKR